MNKMAMNMRGSDWVWLIVYVLIIGLNIATLGQAYIDGDMGVVFFLGLITIMLVYVGLHAIRFNQIRREQREKYNGRN